MRFLEVRQVLNLSIDELAYKSGINRSVILDIEDGYSPQQAETVHQLSKALSVNGLMIEEFWSVLGEPERNSFFRWLTPEKFAEDLWIVEEGEILGYAEMDLEKGFEYPVLSSTGWIWYGDNAYEAPDEANKEQYKQLLKRRPTSMRAKYPTLTVRSP